jgi:flagellar protein FlbD
MATGELPISLADNPQWRQSMIQLTRLNNSKVSINSDLIKWVEQNPDTVITLLNGEKLLVQETVEQVVDRVIEFRRQLLSTVVSWTGMRAGALPIMYSSPEGQKESEG